MAISPISEIIDELKRGRMVVLMDDADRENEGDVVIAAEHVTPDAVNFMAKYARGLICMPVTVERARQLHLAPMVAVNRAPHGTNFTASRLAFPPTPARTPSGSRARPTPGPTTSCSPATCSP